MDKNFSVGGGYIVLGKLLSEHINSYKRESLHFISHKSFGGIKLLLGLKLVSKFLKLTKFSNLIRPGFDRVNSIYVKVE